MLPQPTYCMPPDHKSLKCSLAELTNLWFLTVAQHMIHVNSFIHSAQFAITHVNHKATDEQKCVPYIFKWQMC